MNIRKCNSNTFITLLYDEYLKLLGKENDGIQFYFINPMGSKYFITKIYCVFEFIYLNEGKRKIIIIMKEKLKS